MKKVSIFLITYNHEAFIAKAIESIVSQKVNFDFELVIGEDCSKDTTREICERYAKQYPGIIKLLPSEKNYGPMGNSLRTLMACKGEYIALCEGDDYWIDNFKLQKQIDFLDANPGFTMCFTDVKIIDEMGDCLIDLFPRKDSDVYTLSDFVLAPRNIIPTATLVFRNVLPDLKPGFFLNSLSMDLPLIILLSDLGKAKYLPEITAVYRNHMGGVTKTEKYLKEGEDALMKLYEDANKYYNYKYNSIFRKRLLEMSKSALIFRSKGKKGIQKLKHYFKRMPDYLKYSDRINLKELIYYQLVLFFPSVLKKRKS